MKQVWAGAIAMLMLLLIVAVVSAQGDPLQQGAKLYAANCAVCHGVQGQGRVGARLQDFPSINPQAFVKVAVANGVPGSKMPAWSKAKGGPLTDTDIDAIAAYVASWTTGVAPAPTEPPLVIAPLPTVVGVTGDPTRGAQVFQQNCVVCHGDKGGGRAGANLAKPLASAFPAAFIRQTVSQGVQGSTMPAWASANGGPLTEQQIDDVTAFVLAAQKTTPRFIEPTPTPTSAVSGILMTVIIVIVLIILIAVVIVFSARGASKS